MSSFCVYTALGEDNQCSYGFLHSWFLNGQDWRHINNFNISKSFLSSRIPPFGVHNHWHPKLLIESYLSHQSVWNRKNKPFSTILNRAYHDCTALGYRTNNQCNCQSNIVHRSSQMLVSTICVRVLDFI